MVKGISIAQNACRLFPDSLQIWNLINFILLNQNQLDLETNTLSPFCPLLYNQVPSQSFSLSGENYINFLDSSEPFLQFLKRSTAVQLSSGKTFDEKLVTICYTLLRTNPLSLDLWKLLSTTLFLQSIENTNIKNIQTAEFALKNTLDLNKNQKKIPEKEIIFFILARSQCLLFLGNTKEALKILENLNSSKFFLEKVWIQKGRCFLKEGKNFNQILYAYKESLKISINFQSFFELGLIYQFHLKNLSAANLCMEQALKVSNNSQEKLKSFLALSHIKFNIKRYKDSLHFSEKACSLFPNCSIALFLKGLSQLKLGDLNGAEKSLERVLTISPQTLFANYYLSIDHFISKKFDESESDLLYELDIENNQSVVFYQLGRIYLQKNQKEKAKEYFEKAKELDPTSQQILAEMSQLK